MTILDSGNRREYETGAVRDIQEGKGRCDLLPLEVIERLLESSEIHSISLFQTTGNVEHLIDVLTHFAVNEYEGSLETMILEVSIHFSEGSKKYGIDNWKKGIPLRSYIDSSVRHLLKYKRGDKDEAHDKAFVWNIMCAAWTAKMIPNLNDFTVATKPAPGLGNRNCVETTCYYNNNLLCTSTSNKQKPSYGADCPDYMED